MRDYRFRAWDNETKEMSYDFLSKNWLKVCIESPYVEIMQYTGVHDDTDDQAELYEDDIVEVEHEGQKHICKVQYCGGGYMFVADSLPDGYMWFSDFIEFEREYCWAEGTKKLGNIHDNPDLLGG